jgi:hypothetical protein
MHTCLQDGVQDLAVDGALCDKYRLAKVLLIIAICSFLVCSRSLRIASRLRLLEEPECKAHGQCRDADRVDHDMPAACMCMAACAAQVSSYTGHLGS